MEKYLYSQTLFCITVFKCCFLPSYASLIVKFLTFLPFFLHTYFPVIFLSSPFLFPMSPLFLSCPTNVFPSSSLYSLPFVLTFLCPPSLLSFISFFDSCLFLMSFFLFSLFFLTYFMSLLDWLCLPSWCATSTTPLFWHLCVVISIVHNYYHFFCPVGHVCLPWAHVGSQEILRDVASEIWMLVCSSKSNTVRPNLL